MAFGVRTNRSSSFPPNGSKMEMFLIFFDILTIHNDEISFVKHVLDFLCVFFTLFLVSFGGGGGGGGGKGAGAQRTYAVFQPPQLKNGNFRN